MAEPLVQRTKTSQDVATSLFVTTIMEVSVRELKNHLSEYLRRANAGQEVTVTAHGKVVARLLGPRKTQRRKDEALARLRSQPWIRAGQGKMRLPQPLAPAKNGEESLSDWVSEQRG